MKKLYQTASTAALNNTTFLAVDDFIASQIKSASFKQVFSPSMH
jgi:hypothetical protein